MDKRQSPRKAIQSWLHHQDTEKDNARYQGVADDDPADSQPQWHQQRAPGLHSDYRIGHNQPSSPPHGPIYSLDDRQPIAKRGVRRTALEQHRSPPRYFEENHRLAEQLGLYEPFRQMEAKGIEEAQELKYSTSRRKRRRTSSSSSDLEPAFTARTVDAGYQEGKGATSHTRRRDSQRHDQPQAARSSGNETLGKPGSSSPAQPSKLYERKPRHKTKENRYELKHEKTSEKVTREKTKRKTKRPSRKEKTGSALLRNFTADNVMSDRLTLRPSTRLGLFSKGRASSTIRRGLPDLVFSDLNFKSTGRKTSAVQQLEAERKMRQMQNKNANDDNEISRFFASTQTPLHERDSNGSAKFAYNSDIQPVRQSQEDPRQQATVAKPFLASVDAPIKPFLGWGAPGPHRSSSKGPQSNPRPSISPIKQSQGVRSPSTLASYLTWSASLDKPQSSRRGRTVGDVIRGSPDELRPNVVQPLDPLSEVFGSPTRIAGSRKPVQVIECTRDATAHTEASHSYLSPAKRSFTHVTEMLKHIQPGSNAKSIEEDETIVKPLIDTPQIHTCGSAGALETFAPSNATLYHARSPTGKSKRSDDEVPSAKQDVAIDFTAAVQQLDEQWKDNVDIPADLATIIQLPRTDTSRVWCVESLKSISPKERYSPVYAESGAQNSCTEPLYDSTSVERCYRINDDRIRDESNKNDRPSAGSHISIDKAPGPSRGSTARSQPSWPMHLAPEYRDPINSPFQDSTYSTYRGGASIYEQQLQEVGGQSWPDSSVNRIRHSFDTGRRRVDGDVRERHFDLPFSYAHYRHRNRSANLIQPATQTHLEHSAASSTLQVSSPRHKADNCDWERWLRHSEAHQDDGLPPVLAYDQRHDRAGFSALPLEDLPHSSPRFQTNMSLEEVAFDGYEQKQKSSAHFGSGDSGNYQRIHTRPYVDHINEEKEDEDLVGFWKPNPLY